MDYKESLSAVEAAELLKITKNTVYELVKRGEIPSYKVGKKLRIDKCDVEEYINKQKGIVATKNNNEHVNEQSVLKKENDIIISGQDMILDIIAEKMRESEMSYRILRANAGSYTSLFDLYNDKISMCSCHLWDGDTDEYNISYVKKLLPGTEFILINLAYRNIGFYVEKGNPHKIQCWNDLLNEDITIVNREKGSGVRILIDEKLRVNNIDNKNINGYKNIKQSHFSVAASIARGEGNVGVGNEKVTAQVKGIDFIPIQEEKYDIVIKKCDLEKPFFKEVIALIQSKDFKSEVESLGFYDLREIGKVTGL